MYRCRTHVTNFNYFLLPGKRWLFNFRCSTFQWLIPFYIQSHNYVLLINFLPYFFIWRLSDLHKFINNCFLTWQSTPNRPFSLSPNVWLHFSLSKYNRPVYFSVSVLINLLLSHLRLYKVHFVSVLNIHILVMDHSQQFRTLDNIIVYTASCASSSVPYMDYFMNFNIVYWHWIYQSIQHFHSEFHLLINTVGSMIQCNDVLSTNDIFNLATFPGVFIIP